MIRKIDQRQGVFQPPHGPHLFIEYFTSIGVIKSRLLTPLIFLFAILAGGLGTYVAFTSQLPAPEPKVGDDLALLAREISAYQRQLLSLAEAYLADSAQWSLDRLVGSRVLKRLQNISRDENGNIYFILEWTLGKNWGIVWKSGTGPLQGDGAEPTITVLKHLYESWWYYEAS